MSNQMTYATEYSFNSPSAEAARRQLVEANKSAVGVAMQFLVFVDKIHDMQQRNVVSKEDQNAFSAWALGCAYATCGITSAGSAHMKE